MRRASIRSTGRYAPVICAGCRCSAGRRALSAAISRARSSAWAPARGRTTSASACSARCCLSGATARWPSTSSRAWIGWRRCRTELGFDQAAALPIAAGTALQAVVDEARLGAGQRILITGAAGGVGHFAVQIAKHVGAHVVGVCGAANADFVRGLGADEVVDYARDDFTRRDDRFDVVFDAACASSFTAARARAHRCRLLPQHRRRCGRRRGHGGERIARAGQLPPARGRDRAGRRIRALGAARGARAGGRAARRTSSARSRSRTSRTRSARWKRATGAARSSCASPGRRESGARAPAPVSSGPPRLSAGDGPTKAPPQQDEGRRHRERERREHAERLRHRQAVDRDVEHEQRREVHRAIGREVSRRRARPGRAPNTKRACAR